ncbi:MAG: polyprenyl synthetase family protein [Candidatus Bathyarchaeia archaeon]
MPPQENTDHIRKLIAQYGQKGYQAAKKAILTQRNMPKSVQETLRYFIEEIWQNTHHPALMALSCAAAGGKPEAPNEVAAALVLLTGAADMHDDIVDKSNTKGSKPTVLGKFGQDFALLAGDALLFKGLFLLHAACEDLPKRQRRAVMDAVESAFFEIGNAMANEKQFVGRLDADPEEYRRIVNAKGAMSECCTRIGAILADAEPQKMEALSHFGRTLGVLMTMRNEFADLLYPEELRNRVRNETLPLPLMYALRSKAIRKEILDLLSKRQTNPNMEKVARTAMKTKQVQILKKEMEDMADIEARLLQAAGVDIGSLVLLLRFSNSPP